jgi:hypothetical protein
VETALLLERHLPGLRHQLAAAVEFAQESQRSPSRASKELRELVVQTAWEHLRRANLGKVLPRDFWLRQAMGVMAGLALVGGLLLLRPQIVLIGARRLCFPWQEVTWPQRYHLLVLSPVQEVVRGRDFEVAIVDREGKRLPPGGRVWFRFSGSDGRTVVESLPLQYVDAATAARRLDRPQDRLLRGGVWIARREAVQTPFWYRAEAGDDQSMPWLFVRTAEAPAVDSLVVEIVPPPYTGWQAMQSEGSVAALEGSRIVLRGTATKPLSAVLLRVDPQGSYQGKVLQGRQFSAEFVATQSGSYQLVLTDSSGLAGGEEEKWQLRVFPDGPPSVQLRLAGGMPRATPQARILLELEARDDVGLKKVELLVEKGEGPPQVLPMYQGAEFPGPPPADFASTGPLGERRVLSAQVELGQFGVSAGARITLAARAEDYRGLLSQSSPLAIEVVTPEQLSSQLSEHQRGLLAELVRALELQRNAQQMTSAEKATLQTGEERSSASGGLVEGALWTQREVGRILVDSSESVAVRAEGLLAMAVQNHLASPELVSRLSKLRQQLWDLKAGPLGAAEEGLLGALRQSEWLKKPDLPAAERQTKTQQLGRQLDEVLGAQAEVIRVLAELIAELEISDTLASLQQQLAELAQLQAELHRQSQAVAKKTAGRTKENLSSAERTALQALADQQRELGERFQRFSQNLRQWAASAGTEKASSQSAVQSANRLESGGIFPRTAIDLAENRMGQALRAQQEIMEELQRLRDLLSRAPEDRQQADSGLRRELAAGLRRLVDQQRKLREQLESLADPSANPGREQLEQVASQQESLRQQLGEFQREYRRELPPEADQKLSDAGQSMQDAATEARQGRAQLAADQAAKAEKMLSQLEQELSAQWAESLLAEAAEQLRQLHQGLETVLRDQQALHGQTVELARRVGSLGELPRREQVRILQLADQQRTLAAQVDQLPIPREAVLLGSTAGKVRAAMEQAETSLRDRQLGRPTQLAQRRAITLLEQMLATLAPSEQPQPLEAPAGAGQTASNQPSQTPGDQPPSNPYFLLELRLVRNLQESLRAETAELAQQYPDPDSAPEEVRQWTEQLRAEQEGLAQMLIELLKSAAGPNLQLPTSEVEEAPQP